MLPPPGVLLQPMSMLARSKCVPNKIEPGVVDEPVKNPFGLQRYVSLPINQPFDLLVGPCTSVIGRAFFV